MKTRWIDAGLALGFLLSALSSGCSVAGKEPVASASETFHLCMQCHGENALGNQSLNAPSIAGLPQWYVEGQLKKFKAGGRGTHFDDITGMQMRPMAMSLASDAEIVEIAKYIAQLPAHKPTPVLTGGDPAKGQTWFATCTACHMADAAGNEALKAPPLTHANDWYMFSSIQKFKAGIRGTNPLDTTGATMRPMSQTLPDEQAIKDVVAYIVTLQK